MDYHEAIEALRLEGGIEITGNPRRVAEFFNGIDVAISAIQELEEYKKLKEAGRLIKLPCAVGDTVYEIIHDDVPECVDYICKYTVDDISANAINFGGDWNPLDSIPNVFFSREDAEEALRRLKEGDENGL